jgi:hypothetical protein
VQFLDFTDSILGHLGAGQVNAVEGFDHFQSLRSLGWVLFCVRFNRFRSLMLSRFKRLFPAVLLNLAQSTVIRAALRQGDVTMVQRLLDAGTTARWDWICETMR